MEFRELLKYTSKTVLANIIVYILASLIFIFGVAILLYAFIEFSPVFGIFFLLIVTPLQYGFTSMFLKGANMEKVKLADLNVGFTYTHILRSWIYMTFMFVVSVAIFAINYITLSIFALQAAIPFLVTSQMKGGFLFFITIITIIMVGLSIAILPLIFIQYAFPLYVMMKCNVMEAFSKSYTLVKNNFARSAHILILIMLINAGLSLPLQKGWILSENLILNLLYIAACSLSLPFIMQLLVNATIDLEMKENQLCSLTSIDTPAGIDS